MQNLVIVESPTKAKTLSKFLGSKYQIEASMGHIRDLPKSELGVDVENNFEPRYIVPRDKTKRVNELKKVAVDAKTLWLATDPDREGEAIAWHIKELLQSNNSKGKKQKVKIKIEDREIKRVVFHEITPEAIEEAFANPRNLDLKLVDAQQARRVLDRLVGYKLSPLLWAKVKSGLSAGRVQSVAVRLVVDKEREITAFKAEEYWSIEAELTRSVILEGVSPIGSKKKDSIASLQNDVFFAALVAKNGKKLEIKNEAQSKQLVSDLEKSTYIIDAVNKKEVKKNPAPPFTTSTLQQTAANKLGMSAKKTMMVAQHLYEHGLITYMRTDSVNLSEAALGACRKYIETSFGKNYLPPKPRFFKTSSKLAQEAHEAIRPTKMEMKADELKTASGMMRDHVRLYDLIWKRMIACQMSEAVSDATTVDVVAKPPVIASVAKQSEKEIAASPSAPRNDNVYNLRASGSVIKFEGFLKVYGIDPSTSLGASTEEEEKDKNQILPELAAGDPLNLLGLKPEQHFTQPPARFTDASLIKKLEELGIGRPSTYAPTLSTIQERYYVEKREKKFFPTELGVTVTDFLVKNFSEIVDFEFTAEMENSLDEVASGEKQWRPTIGAFYTPFEKQLESVEKTVERVEITVEMVDKECPKCGKPLQVKFGRFGKFLACSGFPDCKHTENLEEKLDLKCPDCGGDIVVRHTKKRRLFYGCKNYPTCKFASWTKPKSPSLTKSDEASNNS